MKQIFVYTGTGAYQARDIENFLNAYDITYDRLCEHQLEKLRTHTDAVFIIPGGHVNAYLTAWGNNGREEIKHFIKEGGVYIGICAGAYVAGSSYQKNEGLGLFQETFLYKEKQEILKTSDKEGNIVELIFENGPDFSSLKADEVLLKDENNIPYAISIKNNYFFAAHPEGSVHYQKDPRTFSGAKFFYTLLEGL